jgi:hypothetical protein
VQSGTAGACVFGANAGSAATSDPVAVPAAGGAEIGALALPGAPSLLCAAMDGFCAATVFAMDAAVSVEFADWEFGCDCTKA